MRWMNANATWFVELTKCEVYSSRWLVLGVDEITNQELAIVEFRANIIKWVADKYSSLMLYIYKQTAVFM